MAKKMGPRFKMCRRFGVNIINHPKAMKRAGLSNSSQKKMSDYGRRLLEKQKLKAYYGILEKQLKRYVSKAMSSKGITGDILIQSLELRLDNMVYRMGFASSIRQARQMVNHGHIRVNGKKVDIPSYELKPGDVLTLKEKSKKIEGFINKFKNSENFNLDYIERNTEDLSAKLVKLPDRKNIPIQVDDQLIIEFYSRK